MKNIYHINILLTGLVTALTLATLYIATKTLGAEKTGSIFLMQSIMVVSMAVLIPRMNEYVAERYIGDEEIQFLKNTLKIAFIFFLLAFLAQNFIYTWVDRLFLKGRLPSYDYLYGLYFLLSITQINMMTLRLRNANILAKLPEVVSAASFFLMVLSLGGFNMLSVNNYLEAWCISTAIGFLLSLFLIKNILVDKIRSASNLRMEMSCAIKKIPKYYLVGLIKNVNDNYITIIMGHFASLNNIAVFEIAKKIVRPVMIVSGAITQVQFPKVIRNKLDKSVVNQYTKKVISYNLIIVSIFLVIYFLAKDDLTNGYAIGVGASIILFIASTINLMGSQFYALAVNLNFVGRRNLVSFVKLILTIGLAVSMAEKIDPISASLIILFGAVFTRVFFDYWLYRKLGN